MFYIDYSCLWSSQELSVIWHVNYPGGFVYHSFRITGKTSIPMRDRTCLKGLVQSHSKGSDGSGPQVVLLSAALPVRVLSILCSSPHGATCKYTATAAGEYGATEEACTCEQMGVARDGQPSREPQHGRRLLQVVKISIKTLRTIPGTIKHFA